MADEDKKAFPPYLPYKTFKRLIGAFRETAVPQRIDPSVLSKFSGSESAALIPALKFFNLIDKDQMVQPLLNELVNSYDTAEWKDKIKNIIVTAYADIINGLDLSSATRKQLDEKFEAVAATAVSKKCVRFYISAATEGGIPLSNFIMERQKTRGVRAGKIPKNKTIKKVGKQSPAGGGNGQGEGYLPDPQSAGYREFPLPIKGKKPAKIWIPEDITKEDWDSVKRMMELTTEMIQAYFGFSLKK